MSASLLEVIGLAMRGNARALMHLETSATDGAAVAEAIQILQTTQGAVAHFAATLLVRHARNGGGDDGLGELCGRCLALALGVQAGAMRRRFWARDLRNALGSIGINRDQLGSQLIGIN
eukprot:SAG31_NODE_7424_length_1691_cov_2.150754_2_plen_119_part_00